MLHETQEGQYTGVSFNFIQVLEIFHQIHFYSHTLLILSVQINELASKQLIWLLILAVKFNWYIPCSH